jgi:hypothetical protein
MRFRLSCAILLTLLGVATAGATPIIQPTGLVAGDAYYLVFVTAGSRDATSTDLAVYDAFVKAQANSDPLLASLGTRWKVIGSTAAEDAVTHIAVDPVTGGLRLGAPIYNLHGDFVAGGFPDLFDSTILNPIAYTQSGTVVIEDGVVGVWTGSTATGTRDTTGGLDRTLGAICPDQGPPGGPSMCIRYGYAGVGSVEFLGPGWITEHNDYALRPYHFYGISERLIATPEPSTVSLLLGPLLLMRRRRSRRFVRVLNQVCGPCEK